MADYQTFSLAGKVCLVTGASRGIGKGIALQLGQAGATVYITGRTLTKSSGISGSLKETASEVEKRGGKCIPLECDHSNDSDVKRIFDTIAKQQDGQLDVLVNNAYSAIKTLTENVGKKFWEEDLSMWDTVNNVGLRGHYICTVHAAKLMVPRRRGLIVNVSSPGGVTYLFNPAYGAGKEALDRMTADCAVDLNKHNVAMVSFWPGGVKTETFMDVIEKDGIKKEATVAPGINTTRFEDGILNGESPELSGIAIAALATDPKILRKTGYTLMASDLAEEYGFVDIDGTKPVNFRQLNVFLRMYGMPSLAAWVPNCIKIPRWIVWLRANRL